MRNNAYYVVLVVLFVFFFYVLKKKAGRKAILVVIFSFLLLPVINQGLITITQATISDGKSEAGTLFFSVSAYYEKMNGKEATSWEKKVISDTLGFPYEELDALYDPIFRDASKSHFNAQVDFLTYLNAWIQQGLKHPGIYLDGLLLSTRGYWAPSTELYIQDLESTVGKFDGPSVGQQWPNVYWGYPDNSKNLSEWLNVSTQLPLLTYLFHPGFYTWLIIFFFGYLCCQKKCRLALIIFLPLVLTVLSCMASPLGNSIRYMFPIVCTTPIVCVASTWFGMHGEKRKKIK